MRQAFLFDINIVLLQEHYPEFSQDTQSVCMHKIILLKISSKIFSSVGEFDYDCM